MNPHMEALGFTLIHFCWQAAIIAALYKGLEIALPKLRPQARYTMSLTALLAMLTAAILTFVYEEMRLSQVVASDFTGVIPAEIGRQLHLSTLLPWFDAAWLIGVAALSVRMLSGLWYIHGLKKQAQPALASVQHRFDMALRRFGLKGKVRIRLHPAITGPFVVGAIRSIVYLPLSAVTSLSPEQLDAVLSHELEHIRRADYVWNLIQSLIETLFFYHPAVWWIGAKLREQRELCCDDAAIRACDDPITYATALLSLEEQRRGVPSLSMALNGQGKNDLLARISRILGEKTDPRLKARPVAFVLLPVMLLTLTAFAAAPVREVAAKICPQSAATANAALAKLETVMAGNSDRLAQVSDIQSAKSDFDATQSDRQAAQMNWQTTDWRADDIDPDAIAAQARADAIKARAEIARAKEVDIDPQALAAQARADAQTAKAEMERAGITDHQIDPEAIAAQVLAETQRAKADVARLAMQDINPDQIAAQARAGAMQAKADYAAHQAEYQRYKSKPPKAPKPPKPPRAPEAPSPVDEVPAPLAAPDAPEPPAAPPAPPAPLAAAWRIISPTPAASTKKAYAIIKPVQTGYLMVVPTPVIDRTSAPVVTLDRMPTSKAMPIPAPNPVTDVHINVRSDARTVTEVAINTNP